MRKLKTIFWVAAFLLAVSGCNYPGFSGSTTPPGPTPTLSPPTSTAIPLAASVNGEGITLAAYLEEIARFEAEASRAGTNLATLPDYRGQVLWSLIDIKLLAQGAIEAGYQVEEDRIEARIADLQITMGSVEAFEGWLSENLYSFDSFRRALEEELLAAEMVAMIAEGVPSTAEQVHVRHLLVATREEAEALRTQILGGEDFGEVARIYSIDASTRPVGGDLGWFPSGYVLWPEVDQAAFALAPGELSQVVQSDLGYHLLEMLERGEHQLDFETRLFLQEQAVQDWLTDQKNVKELQIFNEP